MPSAPSRLDRTVAVKLLPESKFAEADLRARFPKPGDTVLARGTTLVFSRQESVGSVWTMKLPE